MKCYKTCRSPTDTVIYYCSLFNLFFFVQLVHVQFVWTVRYSNIIIVIVIVIVIVIGLSRVQFGL